MNWSEVVTLSVDDVDSRHGGCTTHFTALLLAELSRNPNIMLIDYPLLVRLNPAIPWKTRGNAAVVLRLAGYIDEEELLELASWLASEYSSGLPRPAAKSPGIIVYRGRPSIEPLRRLYVKGLTGVVTRDVAETILAKVGAVYKGGRGIVGAASSIAALTEEDDYTFELLVYRDPDVWGSRRCLDLEKLKSIERALPPCVFNNYDYATNTVLATPHGPDPVLAGFRGDCPEHLPAYINALCEKPYMMVVFRSNQHTDAHAIPISKPTVYSTGVFKAKVSSSPRVIAGGHVKVNALINNTYPSTLLFYRETGPLNKAARLLHPGDEVEVLASVKPSGSTGEAFLAVEKMRVLSTTDDIKQVPPTCPWCGTKMKSKGKRGGYVCNACGWRTSKKVTVVIHSRLLPGVYAPHDSRVSHLAAPPYRRPKRPKTFPLIEPTPPHYFISMGRDPPPIILKDPLASSGAH